MNPDYRETVIRKVFTSRGALSSETNHRVDEVVRKFVTVPNFRPGHAHKAPTAIKVKGTAQSFEQSHEVCSTFLQAWIEASPGLQDAVKQYASTNPGLEANKINWQSGFPAYWTGSDMAVSSSAFREQFPEYAEQDDDVCLMLCLELGRLPVPDDDIELFQSPKDETFMEDHAVQPINQNNKQPESHILPVWDNLIAPWISLPAESPEWDQVDDFIAELHELTTQKLNERKAGLLQLRKAIDELVIEAGNSLEFFQATNVANWDVAHIAASRAEALTVSVTKLRLLFYEYQALDQRSVSSLTERRERRNLMERAEEKIQALHIELNDEFQQPAFTDILGSEGEGECPFDDNSQQEPENISIADSESREVQAVIQDMPLPSGEVTLPIETKRDEKPVEISPTPEIEEQKTPLPADESQFQADEIKQLEGAIEILGGEQIEITIPTDTMDDSEPKPNLDVLEDDDTIEQLKPSCDDEKRSIAEIAARLDSQDTLSNRQTFFSKLIQRGDTVGAYWLAKSWEATGDAAPFASWLLAAFIGSQFLAPDPDAYANELMEICQKHSLEEAPATYLMGIATALKPVLIAPFTGLVAWLKSRDVFPEVTKLVNQFTAFSDLGITLNSDDIEYVSGATQSSNSLARAVSDAKQWMSDAPQRRTTFKRATDVWRYWVGSEGELRKMMKLVGDDKRSEIDAVIEISSRWSRRDYVIGQINDVDVKVFRVKSRPIDGGPRAHLLRDAEEACSLARRWCRLVRHEKEIEKHGTWRFDQIAKLRKDISIILPAVESAISELITDSQPDVICSAAHCLQKSIADLKHTLKINGSTNQDEQKTKWDWLADGSSTLPELLNRRLLYFPELNLEDEIQISPADLPTVYNAIRSSYLDSRVLEDVWERWINAQDFRFLNLLAELSPEINFQPDYQEQLLGMRAALRDAKSKVDSLIEQAVVDGIIAEERSEYSAKIEQINPDSALRLGPLYVRLQNIQGDLEQARQKRLTELQNDWKKLEPALAISSASSSRKEQASRLLQAAFERKDTRLVDEYLSRLMTALDSNTLEDEEWIDPVSPQDDVQEYIRASGPIEEWLKERNGLELVSREIRDGVLRAGIKFSEISPLRRNEAESAINSWRTLKQIKARPQSSTRGLMQTILTYLGFTFEASANEPLQIQKNGDDWLYAQASMTAATLAKPIPQFGSLAKGRYHLICLWERPGADTIMSRILQLRLNLDSVIVFYFGRITIRQRYEIVNMTNDQQLSLAVLDDILLTFLAQERDARLPTFLRCALPFASLNPYTPFQAGDVPSEMFYGRQDKVLELQRADGSCLVYGGRQLGKSALLRQVQREFHDSQRNQYAAVQDIKLIGDPATQPNTEIIWRRIRECFKEFGLLPQRITTDKSDEIERYVKEVMNAKDSGNRRVIILFDEADNFLDADARDNFKVTESLRTLMVDTQRRFKVVFAGLHNVQRFQALPNQPLAHFGTPIVIGPLEPKPAIGLITEPLFVLGFRFEDDAGPLRILSYTNYHPGLIQLFCQHLLSRMRSRLNKLPPYYIRQNDIEAVYLQVKDRVRERFDWTLALDMSYQAIAWSLSEDQMQVRDGYSRSYSADEILRIVRYWWPQGFPNDVPYLRSILTEMIGLGVLVKDNLGNYRLRSPNLVRLMGTEAEIQEQLLLLADKQPARLHDTSHYHAPLDDRASRYSPLTYEQERSLNQRKDGVGLIFASEGSGLKELRQTLLKFVDSDGGRNPKGFEEIPLYVSSMADLDRWLDAFMLRNADHDYLLAYHALTESNQEELRELVRAALEYCRTKRSKKQTLRVMFVFDPQSTWRWLTVPVEERREMEHQADAALYPRLWDLVGVQQRLTQHDKIANQDVCQKVLQATGGWHLLMDTLFDRVGRKDDPRDIATMIDAEWRNSDSALRKQMYQTISLPKISLVAQIASFLDKEGSVPMELITPEFLGADRLSQQDVDASLELMLRMNYIHLDNENVQLDEIVKTLIGTNAN
jgi:hypothetical protein